MSELSTIGESGADRAMLGVRIGNYVIERLLGAGGMGAVYAARHPEIGRQVAIKILVPDLHVQAAERFVAEARAVARIRNPHVIDIYDFGRTDSGSLYYVMEFLGGRGLDATIRDHGAMTPRQVAPYVQQLCAGLQAAHDCGVVHRDLKPANIFVVREQPLRLKILDFGLAKLFETAQHRGSDLTDCGFIMGTPQVIAPEQAAGQIDQISPQTDIYSLGVILYWMLAGRPPFVDEAPGVLLTRHIRDEPPQLGHLMPDVCPAVATCVMQCLAKAPHQRPISPKVLVESYQRALSAEPSGVCARSSVAEGQSVATDEYPGVAPTLLSRPSPLSSVRTKLRSMRRSWLIIAAATAGMLGLAGLVGQQGGKTRRGLQADTPLTGAAPVPRAPASEPASVMVPPPPIPVSVGNAAIDAGRPPVVSPAKAEQGRSVRHRGRADGTPRATSPRKTAEGRRSARRRRRMAPRRRTGPDRPIRGRRKRAIGDQTMEF